MKAHRVAVGIALWLILLAGCGGRGAGAPAPADAASADVADAAALPDGTTVGLKLVMITNGAATPTPGDAVMADRLRGRGFEVTFVSDVAVTAAAVAGQDLILISSSAESGPLGIKIRDVAQPVVCAENGAFPTMGLTGTTLATDYGSTLNQTAIQLAAGASLFGIAQVGSVTIASTPAELGWGVPSADAVVAATMTDAPTHAALFGYAAAAAMPGLAAPARRVGFAIREAVAANLTADGLALFDAAVSFALAK